jgi:hypothetical protein
MFVEQQYSRAYAEEVLEDYIKTKGLIEKWPMIYNQWLDTDFNYAPKNNRLAKWKEYLNQEDNMSNFMISVLVQILGYEKIQLQAVLASSFKLVPNEVTEDIFQKMQCIGEFLCLFNATKSLYKADKRLNEEGVEYRYISPIISLPKDIQGLLNNCQYLPPMVDVPEEVTESNKVSWLSFEKSIFLNSNHHDGKADIEFLNIVNSTAMQFDRNMVDYEDVFEKDTLLRGRTNKMTKFLRTMSEKFYFIYRFDARYRSYASGYQISPQGNDYRKSMINLFKEELITDEY